jgi:DNA-binding CsgD family transcriptional regulator
LIVLGAIASALIVMFSGDANNAPTSPLWFAGPAVAVVVLPLLDRRRFPLAAPAGLWLIAAALSFVDGRLVVFPITVYIARMVSAFLLGNLPDGRRACLGLAVVLAIRIVVVNNPDHAAGDYALPGLFTVAWLAGFALRARAAHAEAAEQRAARGLSNAELAKEFVVSDATVKTQVAHVLAELGLRDRVQAVVFAYESGVIRPSEA